MPSKGIPRWIEAPAAAIGLLLASPLMGFVAVLVKLTSSGPVLFQQERMGRGGRPFLLGKFRSMSGSRAGTRVTAGGDSRVTPFGRVQRKAKLDELPELWHVVTGEMSLVGPRPEVPEMVDLADPLWREVLAVRPGITDPVTLALRNEEKLLAEARERFGDVETFYRRKLLRWKLKGYVKYQRTRTAWSDLQVLVLTVAAIAGGRPAGEPTLEEIVREGD